MDEIRNFKVTSKSKFCRGVWGAWDSEAGRRYDMRVAAGGRRRAVGTGDHYVSLYNCGQALVNANPFLFVFYLVNSFFLLPILMWAESLGGRTLGVWDGVGI